MYFLKCSHCGHLNEVKSEYLIFCSSCNKKLENNYSDWIKRNSDKSFDEFKQIMCTAEKPDFSKDFPKAKKNPKIKYWIAFAVTFTILTVLGQFAGQKLLELFRKPTLDKALILTANEINRVCPIMVDRETRLDNAIVLPNNVFRYNYTLISMVKDSINTEELKNYLEPTILNFVKTSPDLQSARENKVIVEYSYKDKTGVYLFLISVKPEQYELQN